MRKSVLSLIGLLVVLSLVLAACGPAATPTEAPTEAPTEVPTEVPTEAPPEKVQIRWFIGLGTGGNPEQIEAQENVVAAFNASQDSIELVLEIVDNDIAYDTLKTQIAAGNPPDIVGPVGVRGINEFKGMWLDVEPLVKSTGYDISDFDPAQVEFWRVAGEGLIGLPFGVYPSFIYYNRDLFDEAGLDYLPHKYGEAYADGDPWTIEKLEELAMKLTVDANGNDANSPDFDPENIVQFGFHPQWTDPRGQAAMFGAGNFVDADGNAYCPDHWREAFHWYYEGMWEKYFMPNQAYQDSDLLAAGNPFDSGNVAIAHCHLWYTCCNTNVPNWDMAAVPSYNGQVTAKLHSDDFVIMKSTEHPEEAFEVLTYLVGEAAPDLLLVYGAMPARMSLQADFFAGLEEKYPQGVDWQVAIDSLSYPDNPNHEAYMPNFSKADDLVKAFQSKYQGEGGLDLDAEIDTFVSELQAIFEEAE